MNNSITIVPEKTYLIDMTPSFAMIIQTRPGYFHDIDMSNSGRASAFSLEIHSRIHTQSVKTRR